MTAPDIREVMRRQVFSWPTRSDRCCNEFSRWSWSNGGNWMFLRILPVGLALHATEAGKEVAGSASEAAQQVKDSAAAAASDTKDEATQAAQQARQGVRSQLNHRHRHARAHRVGRFDRP